MRQWSKINQIVGIITVSSALLNGDGASTRTTQSRSTNATECSLDSFHYRQRIFPQSSSIGEIHRCGRCEGKRSEYGVTTVEMIDLRAYMKFYVCWRPQGEHSVKLIVFFLEQQKIRYQRQFLPQILNTKWMTRQTQQAAAAGSGKRKV